MKNMVLTGAAIACAMILASQGAALAAGNGYAYEDDNIRLTDYKSLTYSAQPAEVTQEEIEAEMQEILYEYAETEQITEGEAQEGDTANIDYEGKLDGEPFDGGTAEGYDLVLGSGSFIPGFEDGVIGMKVGETKDITLTFPEEYHSEDLAGKEVVFTVTLNYLAGEEIVPELTDEWVKENLDADSIEEYEKTLRADLEEEANANFEQEKQGQILQKLVEQSEVVEIDPAVIEENVQAAVDYYTSYAQMWGMEYSDFVKAMGYDEESILAEFTLTAETIQKQSILLSKIAELENIEVTDEDFEGYLEEMADSYGMENVDELKSEIEEAYAEEEDPFETFRQQFLQEQVVQVLMDNAVYAEEEALDETEELEPVTEEEAADTTEEAAAVQSTLEEETEAESVTQKTTEPATEAESVTQSTTEPATEAESVTLSTTEPVKEAKTKTVTESESEETTRQ